MTDVNAQDEGKLRFDDKVKTVYLVRHAESLQNVSINAIRDAGVCFCIPLLCFLCSSCKLHDAELSDAGKKQVCEVRDHLGGLAFLETHGITVVAHSPMRRARQTAYGLFGGDHAATSKAAGTDRSRGNVTHHDVLLEVGKTDIGASKQVDLNGRFVCLDFAHEIDSCEFVSCTLGRERMKMLEHWIDHRSDHALAVVAQ